MVEWSPSPLGSGESLLDLSIIYRCTDVYMYENETTTSHIRLNYYSGDDLQLPPLHDLLASRTDRLVPVREHQHLT